jgi:hypothetical protein
MGYKCKEKKISFFNNKKKREREKEKERESNIGSSFWTGLNWLLKNRTLFFKLVQ